MATAKKTATTAAKEAEVKTTTAPKAAEVKPAETKKAETAKAEKADAKKEAKKPAAKKATTKKAEIKTEVKVQFADKEVATSDIIANVKKAWTSQFKGKLKDIKTIDIYVKPEEHKAYFVINGEGTADYYIYL